MCGVSGWGFGGDLKKTPRDVLEAQANILVVITPTLVEYVLLLLLIYV